MSSAAEARVVLSFDDGPGPSTPALLDVLRARGVRAWFFLLGSQVERAPEVAARIAGEGHVLGNHTYSHARPGAITRDELVDELARTDALLVRAGARPGTIPVRLPYGCVQDDPRVGVLAALGRPHVGWTADFADWLDPEPADLARRMAEHVDAMHARGRDAVLDLHDSSRLGATRDATVEAVRRLLHQYEPARFILP
jgi:chitin deacetylase